MSRPKSAKSRKAGRLATLGRARSAQMRNVVDLVGERQLYRKATGASIGGCVISLVNSLNWDFVPPATVIRAFETILSGCGGPNLAAISAAADAERAILVQAVGDREAGIADPEILATMTNTDHEMLRVIASLRPNPRAFRAAVELVAALGKADAEAIGRALGEGKP